jgi:hypothetical protein
MRKDHFYFDLKYHLNYYFRILAQLLLLLQVHLPLQAHLPRLQARFLHHSKNHNNFSYSLFLRILLHLPHILHLNLSLMNLIII